ncbi:MAG: hypothetical protein ACYC2H_04160 [Thermoplasmatota archaeon]
MHRFTFTRWAAVLAVAVGLLVLWVEAELGGPELTLAAVDGANLVAAMGAAIACFIRARQETGRQQRGWRFLGAASMAWGLGVTYVAVYDLWLQRGVPFAERAIPFPSLADAGYLAFVPLALAGVILIPRGAQRTQIRIETFLDGLLVSMALLALAWILLLRDLTASDLGSPLQTFLLLAYPWGDVLLAATAVCAWEFVPARERDNLLLVVVGLAFLALADLGFLVLVQQQAVGISAINVLWPAGFVALALGAMRPSPDLVPGQPQPDRERGLVPLAAAAGFLGIGLASANGSLDATLAAIGTVLAGAVAARLGLGWADRQRSEGTTARADGMDPPA